MPKRTDLRTILIIGAGPIVIGQACEFDYSGAQACKALRSEGYRVVLVNSNPATIMTDPDTADAVYIEPINARTVERIIAKERPDALLPTMGGQTALNCALDLADRGVLEKYGVELIGASREAIRMAEDRELFRRAMIEIGLAVPKAEVARSLEQAHEIQAKVGFPSIIRPSFTLGGSGGGIAYNREEFVEIVERGLELSPVHEVWSRNRCSAGRSSRWRSCATAPTTASSCARSRTSIPWACTPATRSRSQPALTLTDKEYQRLRDASIAVLRKIGVDTGGSNVQFGVNSEDGRSW
jgi:carbamoyl-phosphate synthase large subunit